MTSEQQQEFFEQAKGKKIRWTGWDNLGYPEFFVIKTRDGNRIRGEELRKGVFKEGFWYISHGFKKESEGRDGWVFFEDEEKVTKQSCSCDLLQTLMVIGCQCGSV